MKLDEKRIVVTGGAGFIGSHIVDYLLVHNAIVTVIDDLSNGTETNLEGWKTHNNFLLQRKDIRNSATVYEVLKEAEIVFHEAAKVSVPFSTKHPCLTMDVNSQGTAILLNECRKRDVSKIVVASSSSVYGDTPVLPKIETMPTNPLSPYAASKLAGENLAIAFSKTYGMDITALRYFNVYGPRQRSGSYAGVISVFINQALDNRPLTIEGEGEQTRDFTFVKDVVKCNILAALEEKSKGEVYNVGGGSRITILELAKKIKEIVGSSSNLEFLPPRIGDVKDSLAGIDKARKHLGYEPEYDIDTGLELTIDWIRESNG
ncbi:MAG: putative UDP-glucose 4-epimerase [Candidatus Thorarchaeota archaeon]|nr:MAG: putative UDP-glucose 4-epimerase [Candidatus Thorarchaeota archaeon]